MRVVLDRFKDWLVWGLLGLCLVMLIGATIVARTPADTVNAANHLEKRVANRMSLLESYARHAVALDDDQWLSSPLPDDMVLYRYVGDTLKAWINQFTIANDDISSRIFYPRLSNPRTDIISPLTYVTDSVSFANYGPKWYLVRSYDYDDVHVIAGLEVMDSSDDYSSNGVSRHLKLSREFSIRPLIFSGGTAVNVEGKPMFKVLSDSMSSTGRSNPSLIWFTLLTFLLTCVVALVTHRTWISFFISTTSMTLAMMAMYFWGMRMQTQAEIFSPILYADGAVLYSLGAVIIVNLAILVYSICLYAMRNALLNKFNSSERMFTLGSSALVAAVLGIIAYSIYALRSIALNSNIMLEFYKINELSAYSALVGVSFITVLMGIPLLIQMLRPAMRRWTGVRYDAISTLSRIIFAFAFAVFIVGLTSTLGIKKESSKVSVWANRLSIERDIFLELQLRSVENAIAGDVIIASLSVLPNTNTTIQNRIAENYMAGISGDYDLMVFILNEDTNTPAMSELFNERLRLGMPIADQSRFLYDYTANGHARYSAVFTYVNAQYGTTHVLVGVEPKSNREDRGYATIMGRSDPGKVVLPGKYSYARYTSDKLVTYKGAFPYPTLLTERFGNQLNYQQSRYSIFDGYIHFAHKISEEETVIISRPRYGAFNYFLAIIFIVLVVYFSLTFVSISRHHSEQSEKNYYKARVSIVLVFSLVFTLISMALVSVLFVYRRNDANRKTVMSDKVSSIQASLENRCRNVMDYRALASQEFTSIIEVVSDMTKADITLYSPSGLAINSTSPELFEELLMGTRISGKAYFNIVKHHSRYFIHKEKFQGRKYYALYAPVFNSNGDMLCIFCSPYTEDSYEFSNEAVKHSVAIIALFLILLIIARLVIVRIVEKIFAPLIEMGRKMNATNIDDLEYIKYDRDDEITSLVDAYNRMVTDLSESSKKLTQIERDKAWSAMARQVAHEIKNPLTPMKLQLQRIIRLKERNAPNWEDKFDEVAKTILDHIDILTDTANEFSTFAKLYTEEPTLINVDKLLKEEIAMFDNKDNIEFTYMGLGDACVMGPKPQLTRVFVNLLTNSVQAIENMQQEILDKGGEAPMGHIYVSLRKSSHKDDYYDIVFEDNGPGVSEENQEKLFTPNFTTKSSGTGLGLAISRSIIENSNAEIHYSKSFTLQGACFTIVYPVHAE